MSAAASNLVEHASTTPHLRQTNWPRKELAVNQQAVLNPSEMKQKISTPNYAWVIFLVSFVASVTAALNLFKPASLMPVLIGAFKVDLTSAGLLMAVFSFVGVLLALPSGIIVQKFGLKLSGIIAMACLLAGSVIGALSTSYPVFLGSRALEGVGYALVVVVAPAAIAFWFPREKLALPMGLWGLWVPVGGVSVMAAGGHMAQTMGWPSVWWLGAALSLLSIVLFAFFLRLPPWMDAGGPPEKLPSTGKALANRDIWLLMASFTAFVIPTSAFFTFYSTYLTKVRGYSVDHASMTTSLGMLGLLIGSPLAGWLLSLVGRLKNCLTVTLVILALLLLFPFNIPNALIPVWWILIGVAMGFTPTICYAVAPGIMGKPELAGLGLAVLTLGNAAGGLIGAMYFGAITQRAGWNAGTYSLIPLVIIGLIAGRMTKFPEEPSRI